MSHSVDPRLREHVVARDGRACRYCGSVLLFGRAGALTLDHVLPVSRGGRAEPTNLVVACGPCNRAKADRTPAEAGMVLFPPRFFDDAVERVARFEAKRSGWSAGKLNEALRGLRPPKHLPAWPPLGNRPLAGLGEMLEATG